MSSVEDTLESLVRELVKEEPTHCIGEGYDTNPSCLFCDKDVPYRKSTFEDRHEYDPYTKKHCWLVRAARVLEQLKGN